MKKGFTLIELLAVIVILAIISLISVPIVLNIIEESKKKSAVESVNGILDATDKYLIESMITGKTENRFEFPNDKLKIKGNQPESGTLIVDEEGNTSITIKINGYCVRKRFNETIPSIIETDNCIIEPDEEIISSNYKEEILNGADPVIKGNLIPVTIDTNGTVKYADIKKEWYNYENKIWANSVILKDGVSYNIGDTIPENDIKQYYVWIPRYKYKLWNVDSNKSDGAEQAINIAFESKEKEASNGTKNGEWLTHPAFTSFNTNGIWVGKFETSYDEETYTDSSKFLTTNPNYTSAISASNIIIKPNVRSLTNKNVSTFYILGREINENLNSHMMKNIEWGAVAYLTYSIYGKCMSDGCEEVYKNNINTGYLGNTSRFTGQWEYGASITGCSGSTQSSVTNSNQKNCASGYAYNESNNKASTTGNIYGIYDMNGGAWEYLMGVIEDVNGLPMSGSSSKSNSGFNGTYGTESGTKTNGIEFPTDIRYYDLYVPNSQTLGDDTWYKYNNGHLGDGTKEISISKINDSSGNTGLWFNDYAYFSTATRPWVLRGGGFYNGSGSGVFSFDRVSGNASIRYGFRIVLTF